MSIYDVTGNEITADENPYALEAVRLGVHLMPASEGELNMVRRARQFTDIKWKPAANVKRKNYAENDVSTSKVVGWLDQFTAGIEYTGIPYSHGYYSGAYRDYGMLGYQVSIEAFATAVQYADSYFCATDPYDPDDGVYAPYGSTCDTLVCYAMGEAWYGAYSGLWTLVNSGKLVSQFNGDDIVANIDKVHLGDILWKPEVHVAIITDVVIDDTGEVFVEVSESTTIGGTNPDIIGGQFGGVARRELWTIPKFLAKFPGYTVYRYASAANVTYEPSPFVTLQGEDKLHNLLDRIPLVPYMGSGFSYLAGHIPSTNILIGSSAYAYLAVYKDGTLFNTFTINGASSIATGFSAVGSYEAFLYNSTDGTITNLKNRSVSCTWFVISGS